MVRHFHVRHFQSTPRHSKDCHCLVFGVDRQRLEEAKRVVEVTEILVDVMRRTDEMEEKEEEELDEETLQAEIELAHAKHRSDAYIRLILLSCLH